MIWILWFLFIIEEVIRNWYVIEIKKRNINHNTEATIRIAFATLLLLLMFPKNGNLLHVMCWFIGAFFSFWLLFNIGLNALRGKPFGYVGKAALLDKLEAVSPSIIFNVFAKLIIAISFIYGYYNTELF